MQALSYIFLQQTKSPIRSVSLPVTYCTYNTHPSDPPNSRRLTGGTLQWRQPQPTHRPASPQQKPSHARCHVPIPVTRRQRRLERRLAQRAGSWRPIFNHHLCSSAEQRASGSSLQSSLAAAKTLPCQISTNDVVEPAGCEGGGSHSFPRRS